MKEVKENKANDVHQFGEVVRINEPKEGFFGLTIRNFDHNRKTDKYYNRYVSAQVFVKDEAAREQLRGIIAHNAEQEKLPLADRKYMNISVSGFLRTFGASTKADEEYQRTNFVIKPESIEVFPNRQGLAEGERTNHVAFTGTIADVKMQENGSANVLLIHNFRKKDKEYKTVIRTFLNGNYRFVSGALKNLKEGGLAVGDLVTVKGTLNSNKYSPDGTKEHTRYNLDMGVNSMKLICKKGEKLSKSEEEALNADAEVAIPVEGEPQEMIQPEIPAQEAPKAEKKEEKKAAKKTTKKSAIKM